MAGFKVESRRVDSSGDGARLDRSFSKKNTVYERVVIKPLVDLVARARHGRLSKIAALNWQSIEAEPHGGLSVAYGFSHDKRLSKKSGL